MRDKIYDMENKKARKMDVAIAKTMAGEILSREYRGPGDTIEAAAYRAQTRYGVPAPVLMRLRHREVKDMLLSNFMAVTQAYKAMGQKLHSAIEREEATHEHYSLAVTLADLAAGKEAK